MPKPPLWFTIVAVVALLWNLLGLLAVAADFYLVSSGTLTPEQQALVDARPSWTTAGSVIAVLAGTLGSLALVLRRRWAVPALLLSLVGLIVQDVGFATMSGSVALDASVLVLQGLVLVIAIGLVFLARSAAAKGWLR